MPHAEPRSKEQRKAHTLAKLAAHAADVWVSTAAINAEGQARPHMVPLSLAWVDERIVLAAEADSVTVKNIAREKLARLGLGPTRDVVLIDADLDEVYRLDEVPADLAERYAAQADWDPRESGEKMRFLVLRPQRILAWREANEIPGRTLMRGGTWIA